jgi:folate-binding protein YgfZ
MVIEITGEDALKVLNNLTTNQLLNLEVGDHCETFVTDLRGWTVAHGFIHRTEHGSMLVGQHPQPEAVCKHIDRYIIREDARVIDHSDSHPLVLSDGMTDEANLQEMLSGLVTTPVAQWSVLPAPMISPTSQLRYGPAETQPEPVPQTALSQAHEGSGGGTYELLRIRNFWPRMGRDIREKCIPQELDRDAQAISFTKGCYLGQETIARLDARGQLQKKLCRLRIDGEAIAPDAVLHRDEKEVGHITSIAFDAHAKVTYALAFLKRGNFEPDTELRCQQATATVLPPR